MLRTHQQRPTNAADGRSCNTILRTINQPERSQSIPIVMRNVLKIPVLAVDLSISHFMSPETPLSKFLSVCLHYKTLQTIRNLFRFWWRLTFIILYILKDFTEVLLYRTLRIPRCWIVSVSTTKIIVYAFLLIGFVNESQRSKLARAGQHVICISILIVVDNQSSLIIHVSDLCLTWMTWAGDLIHIHANMLFALPHLHFIAFLVYICNNNRTPWPRNGRQGIQKLFSLVIRFILLYFHSLSLVKIRGRINRITRENKLCMLYHPLWGRGGLSYYVIV